MAQAAMRGRKAKVIIEGYDQVEVASIDSFPASDPPGWIEAKAHPCAEADSSTDEKWPEQPIKAAKRVATSAIARSTRHRRFPPSAG